MLKRIGKQGRINLKANQILKKYWQDNNITECEIKLENCLGNWTLGNCHRHKRIFYKEHPEVKLYDINEVVRACQNCHDEVENDEKLREEVFKRLRNT